LNPNEVADLAADRNIVTQQSPFPDILGPQGNSGLTADDNTVNQGLISGQQNTSTATYKNAQGQPTQPMQPQGASPQGPAPQMVTPPNGNQPGQQMMSQPGSGQTTPNSAAGNVQQNNQRRGRK
jgi:hypothetical protein